MSGSQRARLLYWHADGAHERVVVVDMDIDCAGQHEQTAGVQRDEETDTGQVAHSSNALSPNKHVLLGDRLAQDSGTTPDQG